MNRPLAAWQTYLKFYRGTYLQVVVVVAVAMAQALFVVPVTFVVRYAFDQAIPSSNFSALVLCCLVLLLIKLADTGIDLWVRYQTLKVTKLATSKLRSTMVDKLYSFPRAFYNQNDLNHLHNLVVQDTERVDVMSNAIVNQLVPSLAIGVALSIAMALLNAKLFLVLIGVVPILLVLNRVMLKHVRERINQFRQAFEAYSKGTLFILRHMDLTRIQTAEAVETKRQNDAIERLRQTSRAMGWLQNAYISLQSLAVTISNVLILVVGGEAIVSGAMTLGELLSFYVAAGLLNSYVRAGLGATHVIWIGIESLRDVFAFLKQDAIMPYSGTKPLRVQGEIRFENISFQYQDSPVLHQLDLTIPAQSTVAITGANGTGKSTLVSLLLGFYAPSEGRVLIDNCPLAELDIEALRRQVAMVFQDTILFPGTILENITYGLPDADFATVLAACDIAVATEFIEQQPQGFETQVGEAGTLLSGGQRQRIAIARALLRQPRILILDEPTNHLDRQAITQLIRNLQQMETTPTTIIISHDSKVTDAADRVYHMVDGRLQTSPEVIQQA